MGKREDAMGGKARQANMELLRMIAMLMVVTLHYLGKGNAAAPLAEDLTVLNLVLWFVKALCIVSVNLYVLLSGYFLMEAEWKLSRLIRLWLQTFFYSVGIPLLCLALGIGEVKAWGQYDWINVLFPVQMEHYWYITAYVVLYLLIPVLSLGVRHMDQKQHRMVLAGLLLFFSIPKSIFPIVIPTDRYGYDFGWFLCLFLVAAYIRKYEISFFWSKDKIRNFGIYFGTVTAIWFFSVICGFLSRKGFPFAYAMDMLYCYNHILVLLASVALFYGFRCFSIPSGKAARWICRISPYTLGVYLLHENLAIRTQWPFWAGIAQVQGSWSICLHMVFTVTAVFAAGILTDFVRVCLFGWLQRVWKSFFAGKNAKKEDV